MNSSPRLLVLGLVAAFFAASATASGESVAPKLRVGSVWEYDYLNVMAYEGPPHGMTNETKGRMILRITGTTVTNGIAYFTGTTEYHGIFGIPPQPIHVRVDDDGYYTATDIRGAFVESRALALPAVPGTTWDYYDGEPGTRTIAGRETIEHGGHRYADCVRVERGFKDPEKAKQFTQTEWYAPGLGIVRYHFLQRLGPTRSETQTILTSHTPGAHEPGPSSRP